MATASDARWRTSSRRCSTAPATSRRSRPSGRSRRAAASRTSRSWSVSPASTTRRPRSRRSRGFLQEISLYSDQDALRDGEDDGGQVTLMTLHNAKGLEFRAVFMIGMEEGIFPHSRSIEENSLEEERRLCYVGMTRAQGAARAHARDAAQSLRPHEANLPSRFLDELPNARASSGSGSGLHRGRTTAGMRFSASSRRVRTCPTSRRVTPCATRRSAPASSRASRRAAWSPCGSRTARERRLMLEYAPLERL